MNITNLRYNRGISITYTMVIICSRYIDCIRTSISTNGLLGYWL